MSMEVITMTTHLNMLKTLYARSPNRNMSSTDDKAPEMRAQFIRTCNILSV